VVDVKGVDVHTRRKERGWGSKEQRVFLEKKKTRRQKVNSRPYGDKNRRTRSLTLITGLPIPETRPSAPLVI
jgi:hypothetical protein